MTDPNSSPEPYYPSSPGASGNANPQPYYPAGDESLRGDSDTNNKALVALVLSIASFFFTIFLAVAGLVLGYQARTEISQKGQAGAGMAKAAIIVGWVSIAWNVIGGALFFIFVLGALIFGSQVSNNAPHCAENGTPVACQPGDALF